MASSSNQCPPPNTHKPQTRTRTACARRCDGVDWAHESDRRARQASRWRRGWEGDARCVQSRQRSLWGHQWFDALLRDKTEIMHSVAPLTPYPATTQHTTHTGETMSGGSNFSADRNALFAKHTDKPKASAAASAAKSCSHGLVRVWGGPSRKEGPTDAADSPASLKPTP